jgi:hypothetical protein
VFRIFSVIITGIYPDSARSNSASHLAWAEETFIDWAAAGMHPVERGWSAANQWSSPLDSTVTSVGASAELYRTQDGWRPWPTRARHGLGTGVRTPTPQGPRHSSTQGVGRQPRPSESQSTITSSGSREVWRPPRRIALGPSRANASSTPTHHTPQRPSATAFRPGAPPTLTWITDRSG